MPKIDSINGIATDLIVGIAESVLSQRVENLADPIFSMLGLSENTSDTYFKAVMDELKQIEGSLEQITAKLRQLSNTMSAIQCELSTISSQITDAELQEKLDQYNKSASIIDVNYQAYTNALASMQNGDADSIRKGTDELFQIFGITNANSVAVEMRNICDVVTGVGESRGIISYQPTELRGPFLAFASDPSHLTIDPKYYNHPNNAYYSWFEAPPTFQDGSLIISSLPTVLANTLDKTIIPTLKRALVVQLKGLIFLRTAWSGTINQPGIEPLTDGINAVIESIHDMYALFDFDNLTAGVLQDFAQRVTPGIAQLPGWAGLANPFDNSWCSWSMVDPEEGSVPAMVEQPWRYGAVSGYWVENTHGEYPGLRWSGTEAINEMKPYEICVSRPSLMAIPPSTILLFLASLPPTATPDPSLSVTNGTRVQVPGDTAIYLMIDGVLRAIPNLATYGGLFANPASVGIATVKAYPRTLPLTDGAYLATGTPDGKVFLIVDGTKRWIPGPDVFNRYAFNWSNIRTLPSDELTAIPDGALVP